MQVAGVREFRNHATEYLGGNDLIFVTKHDKLASIVVPIKEPKALPVEIRRELLERIGGAISMHLQNNGVSEKRISDDFKAWRKEHRSHSR